MDLAPINFKKWIRKHRHLLQPPVGNAQIWEDREFMVTVVGGPNARQDFHINEGEEFFYQIEGNIVLRVFEKYERSEGEGRSEANKESKEKGGSEGESESKKRAFQDIEIEEGDIFLLPPGVPHSPQRPAGTVGLVLERKRLPGELDGFVWFCQNCGEKLYEKFFHLTNIVEQLPPVFQAFYENELNCTCRKCGTRAQKG